MPLPELVATAVSVAGVSGWAVAAVLAVLLLVLLGGARRRGGAGSARAAAAGRFTVDAEFGRRLAHEIRNSLAVIYSSVALLDREREPAERSEVLAALQQEAERVAALVDRLSTFAALGRPELEDVRFGRLVRAAAKAAGAEAGVPVVVDVEREVGGVRGDPGRLGWLVEVLVVASAAGAARCVRVAVRSSGAGRSGEVTLVVSSDAGADAEPLVAPGAGVLDGVALELAAARRVVDEHEGSVRSGGGDGFHVEVTLPREGPAAVQPC